MKKKQENNYAFIDSQNLNLAIRDQGWNLDFRKVGGNPRYFNAEMKADRKFMKADRNLIYKT